METLIPWSNPKKEMIWMKEDDFVWSILGGGVDLGEHSNDRVQYTTGVRAWVNCLGTEDC